MMLQDFAREINPYANEFNLLPLSYSRLSVFLSCGRRFAKQYIEKDKEGVPMETMAGKVGVFLHRVLEGCMRNCIRDGMHIDNSQFNETWRRKADDDSGWKPFKMVSAELDLAQMQRAQTRQVLEKVIHMTNKYKFTVNPELKFCVPKNFSYPLKNDMPWNSMFFMGYIDNFSVSPSGKHALLLDYKSHKKSDDNAESVKKQMSFYAYYMFRMFPLVETIQTGCVYIPEVDFDMGTVIERVNMDQLEQYLCDLMSPVIDIVKKGVPALAPVKNKECKYCNYSNTCPVFNT